MKLLRSRFLSALAAGSLLGGLLTAGGTGISLTTDPPAPLGVGEDVTFLLTGTPGELPILAVSPNPGPINVPIAGVVDVGLPFYLIPLPIFPASGVLELPCPLTCDYVNIAPFYAQAISIQLGSPLGFGGKSQQVVLNVDQTLIVDCNGNFVDDDCELETGGPDCDGDGILDSCEDDCDGNQVPDACESFEDCNGNMVPDHCEDQNDCDADGVPDDCEPDCDGDGTPDDCEVDCDGDAVPDACEDFDDCDENGVPDVCQPDADGDGIPDACDCPAPTSTCDTGCWQLQNTPTPALGPPGYGLRLGGLFGDGGSAQYTFDFERPGAHVTLCQDAAAGTVTISGLAYGGLDVGGDWDATVQGWVEFEMAYHGGFCSNGDFVVPSSGGGSGSIEWLATGQVAPLVPKLRQNDMVYADWETNGGVYPVFHGWLYSGTFDDPTLTGHQGDFESFAVGISECPE